MQFPSAPAAFHFARELFHLLAIAAHRPNRCDIGAHAGAGNHIHFDAVFFEHLDDADMRETFGAAGGKRQANAAMADFAGKPANIARESAMWPWHIETAAEDIGQSCTKACARPLLSLKRSLNRSSGARQITGLMSEQLPRARERRSSMKAIEMRQDHPRSDG